MQVAKSNKNSVEMSHPSAKSTSAAETIQRRFWHRHASGLKYLRAKMLRQLRYLRRLSARRRIRINRIMRRLRFLNRMSSSRRLRHLRMLKRQRMIKKLRRLRMLRQGSKKFVYSYRFGINFEPISESSKAITLHTSGIKSCVSADIIHDLNFVKDSSK